MDVKEAAILRTYKANKYAIHSKEFTVQRIAERHDCSTSLVNSVFKKNNIHIDHFLCDGCGEEENVEVLPVGTLWRYKFKRARIKCKNCGLIKTSDRSVHVKKTKKFENPKPVGVFNPKGRSVRVKDDSLSFTAWDTVGV